MLFWMWDDWGDEKCFDFVDGVIVGFVTRRMPLWMSDEGDD